MLNRNFKTDELLKEISLESILQYISLDESFNIIPIFMKKSDFTKTTKKKRIVLSKIPFVGGEGLKKYVIKSIRELDFMKIVDAYMSYMNIEIANRSKTLFYLKSRLKIWLDKGFFPLPFIRILISLNASENEYGELKKVLKLIEYVTDYQQRSKFFYPKTIRNILKKFLIYFVGLVYGDGSVDDESYLSVYDGHPNSKNLIYSKKFLEKINNKLNEEYGISGSIRKVKNQNLFKLQIGNKWFIRFFSFIFNLPAGKKVNLKEPFILLKFPEYRIYFWRGIFDSDGSTSSDHQYLSISSSQVNLLKSFKNYLIANNILCRLNLQQNKFGKWYSLYIPSSEIKGFCELIGTSHPLKQKILSEILRKGPSVTVFRGINKRTLKGNCFDFSLMVKRRSLSKHIMLPRKPTKKLMEIARFMRIKNKNVVILVRKDRNKILTDKEVKSLSKKIEKLFGIKSVIWGKNRLLPCFYSSELSKFIRNYFVYEKPWTPENPEKLILEWNDIWFT